MRPAFSRAHGKLENFRVVETRRDVTTFSLETLRVANHGDSGPCLCAARAVRVSLRELIGEPRLIVIV